MREALVTMRGLRAVGVALILIGLCGAMVFTSRGQGWTTERLHQIPRKNGEFLNYDFTSEDRSADNVDWAVSLLWHNAATTRRVYVDLRSHRYLLNRGDPAYGFVTDGSNYVGGKRWHWRGNVGLKDEVCSVVGRNLHMRIYSPNNSLGAIATVRWGFVVIGTVHYDNNECGPIDTWSGESEDAEREIVRITRGIYGVTAVRQDQFRFWNAEGEHDDGSHHWQGNGQASAIRVPARRP